MQILMVFKTYIATIQKWEFKDYIDVTFVLASLFACLADFY